MKKKSKHQQETKSVIGGGCTRGRFFQFSFVRYNIVKVQEVFQGK